MGKLLIHNCCFLEGNIGDEAIVVALTRHLDDLNIEYDLPRTNEVMKSKKPDDYDAMIYIGNDCLACYGIFEANINKFVESGKPVILMNASWTSNSRNLKYMSELAQRPNCHIMMRDPYSLELIKKDMEFVNEPRLGADMAITCRIVDPNSDADRKLWQWVNSSSKPIIGINYHVNFKEYNEAVFDNIVKLINAHPEYRYLFIPHDTRKKEHVLNQKMSKAIKSEHYLSHYMRPEFEKGVTAKCHVVITGRMHLSILTAPNGVPCIPIAYNGVKARGSMAHFGIDNLVIDPSNMDQLNTVFQDIIENHQSYVHTISENLSTAHERSYSQVLAIREIVYGE